MRTSHDVNSIPMDLKKVWVTHLPNFSITEYAVKEVSIQKNGDIRIHLVDSDIYENIITAKSGGKKVTMKRCYHLSEADAALRLREHYRKINADDRDATTKRVLGDTKDKDIMIDNINIYAEKFPEMTI